VKLKNTQIKHIANYVCNFLRFKNKLLEAVTLNLWSVDDKFEYDLMTIGQVIDTRQHI